MEMVNGDGVRIRGDGNFDSWGELLVGRDELLIFEMRPLIHGSGTFGLRGTESSEDPGGWDWGEVAVVIDPWELDY